MPGTSAGARKRLTVADIAAVAPVFGFGNDVDAFAAFICEQQGKADRGIALNYGNVCEREDLGEYGR